jgi:hypothetical protein
LIERQEYDRDLIIEMERILDEYRRQNQSAVTDN